MRMRDEDDSIDFDDNSDDTRISPLVPDEFREGASEWSEGTSICYEDKYPLDKPTQIDSSFENLALSSNNSDNGEGDDNGDYDSDSSLPSDKKRGKKRGKKYVVYSDESDFSDTAGKSYSQAKQLSMRKDTRYSGHKLDSNNFFSNRTLYHTSDESETSDKAVYVPLDKLNLCMFTALLKFKFPRNKRIIKMSKLLFLAWAGKNKVNKNDVFDWDKMNKDMEDGTISISGFNVKNRDFPGIMEQDLVEFERFFAVRIRMFAKRFLTHHVEKDGTKVGKPYTVLVRKAGVNQGPIMDLHVNENKKGLVHVDVIVSLDRYSECFACSQCNYYFSESKALLRHELTCTTMVRKLYKGGPYAPEKTIFEKLQLAGVCVPKDLQFNEFFTVFDFETYLKRTCVQSGPYSDHHIVYAYGCASNVPGFSNTAKVEISDDPLELIRGLIHHFCDISEAVLAINLVRYKKVLDELKAKIEMCDKMNKVVESQSVSRLLSSLMTFITQCVVVTFNGSRFDIPAARSEFHQVLKEMGNYGGTPTEFYQENERYKACSAFMIERGTQVLMFSTDKFKMLDICLFIAPGCNYDRYLKTWSPKGMSLSKLHFPHGVMKGGISMLESTVFPTYKDFWSELKQKNSFNTEKEYEEEKCNWVGSDGDHFKDGKTLRDFLIAYVIGDTEPFLTCLQEHCNLYKDKLDLDLLSHNCTLASLSWRWAFKDEESVFYTIPEGYGLLFDEMLHGRTGGATIIMKREAKVGDIIPARGTHTPNPEGRVVERIKSFDCNSLYPSTFLLPQFTGPPVYKQYPDFVGEQIPHGVSNASMVSYEWLKFIKEKRGYNKMYTAFNTGEVKVTRRNLPVDGYVPVGEGNGVNEPIVFQFYGCFYHGCEKEGCKFSYLSMLEDTICGKERWGITIESKKRYNDTIEISNYMKSENVKVECIWECEWEKEKKKTTTRQIQESLQNSGRLYPESAYSKSKTSQQEVIASMKSGEFFGIGKVDIRVPDKLRWYFAIFPPIFKKAKISINDVGDYTKKLCEDQGEFKTPKEQLITSFKGEGVLLSSGLLKFYLDKGMEITHVYWVLEYTPGYAFTGKVKKAVEIRVESDSNPDLENLGQTMKIKVNAIYGKSGERVDKRVKSIITTSSFASRYIKNPRFKHITPILPPEFAIEVRKNKHVERDDTEEEEEEEEEGEERSYVAKSSLFLDQATIDCDTDLYKVEMLPASITHKLPIQISLFTLCEAKKSLLSFIYDVIDYFLIENSYEILYSDTDNVVVTLNAKVTMDDIIKPWLREEFFTNKHKYFPAESCDYHRQSYIESKLENLDWVMEECCLARNKKDQRQPGLWKTEAEATHAVFLCPKTYCMYNADDDESKISTKGLSKSQNKLELENFVKVLHRENDKDGGVNRGMKRSKSGSVLAYTQYRSALTSIYCKRQVMSDKVSTKPLLI